MTEIRSINEAAIAVSNDMVSASNEATLDPNPFTPPYNNLPVQDDCDNTFEAIAHLTTITAHWCRFLGEDVLVMNDLFKSADSHFGQGWRR